MEGRSPEIVVPTPHQEKTDDGFSEKRLARLAEGVKQDISQVKKRKPPVNSARKVRFPAVLRKRPTLSKKTISRRDKI